MTKDEEIAELKNTIYDLTMDVCRARDLIEPIVEGKIERGHSLAGLPNGPLEPGFRKTTLADARKLCERAIKSINDATKRGLPKPH